MKYPCPVESDLERKYKAMRANKPCPYDTFSDYLHSLIDGDYSVKAKDDNAPVKHVPQVESEDN